jgi:hypothetical protein
MWKRTKECAIYYMIFVNKFLEKIIMSIILGVCRTKKSL